MMRKALSLTSAAMFLLAPIVPANADQGLKNGAIKQVLLISVDGMHALDLANYVKANPNSTFAQIVGNGVNYTNAATTKPSDSFPAMVGIVTGGTPSVTGIYYDDAWHRGYYPPGSNCAGAPGTAIDLKEGIDVNPLALNAGGIDPAKLPLDKDKGCAPVYPHNLLRVNTIFEVIKKSKGGYTAYSEKRPSYDILNGPSGTGVDDLYVPEIAYANPLANDTLKNVSKTEAFDDLRVVSVINEINGKDHTGTKGAPVPTLFGMNFQALNSAKKVSATSGYADHIGTPDALLKDALDHTDASLGQMVTALKANNLFDSTAIVLTAKHGETPLDPPRTIILTSVIPNLINTIPVAGGFQVLKATEKANAIIWLRDQSKTIDALNLLEANRTAIGFGQIFAFESLKLLFPDPLVDPAVPDIIVTPNNGVNYEPTAGSTTKAEHGGLGENDTHVPLVISNPHITPAKVQAPVATIQIAPSILSILRYDPAALDAVRLQGTQILPNITLR